MARTREFYAWGASKLDLTDAVKAGVLLRPRRGIYALAGTGTGVLDALRRRGRLACLSAARQYGLWSLDNPPTQEHFWFDPLHSIDLARMRAGRSGDAHHRDERIGEPDLLSVSVPHCLIQLAWCQGEEAFFVSLESALRQGLISRARLSSLRGRLPRSFEWLLDFARSDADSGLESLLRLRLHRLGISVATQVQIPGVGRVDFVIGDCLIVEADGELNHAGAKRHKDLERDAHAMIQGYVTLRFDYAQIVHEWPLVEAAILAALARRLHRGV